MVIDGFTPSPVYNQVAPIARRSKRIEVFQIWDEPCRAFGFSLYRPKQPFFERPMLMNLYLLPVRLAPDGQNARSLWIGKTPYWEGV